MIFIINKTSGRIDYSIYNFCGKCGGKFPKEKYPLYCPNCKQRMKTKGRYKNKENREDYRKRVD